MGRSPFCHASQPRTYSARGAETLQQTRTHSVGGLVLRPSKSDGQNKRAVTGRDVDFAGQDHIAMLGPVVMPCQPFVLRQVQASVGFADEPDRAARPRRRATDGERVTLAPGKQHRQALELAQPGGVVLAAVAQMGRRQQNERIIGQLALEWNEPSVLQQDRSARVAQHHLLDAITTGAAVVPQPERGHPGAQVFDLRVHVVQFVRKELVTIGHHESQTAQAGRIDLGVKHFGDDSVTEREPKATIRAKRGANAGLGGRGPAGLRPGRRGSCARSGSVRRRAAAQMDQSSQAAEALGEHVAKSFCVAHRSEALSQAVRRATVAKATPSPAQSNHGRCIVAHSCTLRLWARGPKVPCAP